MRKTASGFTIVELLIVIVVIAILAAISIVAYNGIQDRANASASQSATRQAATKIRTYAVENGNCPVDLTSVGIANTTSTQYNYLCDTSVTPAEYCLTSTVGRQNYYMSSSQASPVFGSCYNYLLWDKSSSTTPIPGGTVDTSTYRTTSRSIRLDPGEVGRGVLNSPYSGEAGQVYTMSLWIRTDSNWDGTGGNSKIRFGASPGGSLLKACGYEGVKTSWTQVTCDYTLNSANTTVTISVGNNGSTGRIWLDDFSLTRSY
jgi:prepilin-type N-terminal cleavage/methylation domain-containing protein